MTELYTIADGKLTASLHAGQTRAWDSDRRQVFIIAGTQSGKTSFEPLWLNREIERRGRGDYLAVTATYDLFKLKFLPEMQRFFVQLFGWQYAAGERVLWREDQPRLFTRIIMRSAEAEGGLESATAKAAVLDECGQDRFGIGAYDAVMRRLSIAEGRVLGGTTPYNLGWLKTEIFDRWRTGDPDLAVIQFKSTMNPSFPRAEYDRQKARMPAWKFAMFYDGEFSRPAGLIYEDFTDDLKIDPFDPPLAWPRVLGVDFGGVNNAKLYLAMDPDARVWYVYDELLAGNIPAREHVKEVKDRNLRNLRAWGGAKSELQQRLDWGAAGLPLNEPPIADVEAGIDRVIALFRAKRLYVSKRCRGLIDQLSMYSRELDDGGQPTEKIRDKNAYHFCDALRYASAGIDVPIQIFIPGRRTEEGANAEQRTAAAGAERRPGTPAVRRLDPEDWVAEGE